jgi:type I restriction enzyme S subunit
LGLTFRTATIGDIASVQTGPLGSQPRDKDYVFVGTPIVTVEHLGQRKMTRQNLPRVSYADKERLSKYTLEYGDLVFSRVGSVDRCSWVSEDEDGWMFSGRCLRVRPNDPNEVYHKFLYYFFSLESTKDFVRNIAVGATMPSINTRLLSEVPITFPGIDEQRQIGDALSALDDLIEENSKINNHLEQMARAIFKSWFADFEPSGGSAPDDWTTRSLLDIAMAADKATTMGHIKREALADAEVLIPSDKDYAALGELLAPLYERVVNNRVESRKLALLRDLLLPRLMSGELS